MNEARVALVTTSKGLGRAVVRTLAKEKYRIAAVYRTDQKAAEACVAEARDLGAEAESIHADVGSQRDRESLVNTVMTRFGRLDAVVNSVGEFTRDRTSFSEYPPERVREVLDNNLTAAMLLDSLILPHMRRQGAGRIVHFGFGRALEAPAWPQRAVYAAAKAGLMSFTKSLAAEEARNRITVNMVCPGEIKGPMKEATMRVVSQTIDPENPGMRPGTGEDVGRVVAFLCAADSDYLTGLILDVTGGLDPIRALRTQ